MRQNLQSERRPRGRPQIRSDEETRHLIVEAAARAFQADGYAGTCMGDVALAAGVSTKTLYRLIPTKAELFIDVVTDRIGLFMLAIDQEALAPLGLETGLERILVAYGQLTLDPETIAINRLVIGESERFPEIGKAFYERAIMRTSDAFEAWLRRQAERGLLRLEDPHAAVGMLRGMMIMEPQRAAMLGQAPPPDADAIARRAKLCARLFLDGCRA
ncbi:TetR/AcrR family transcriptional regulator [Labrys wisconsinensis]|uniref:AcrR family transcriptional regulator n=1 Tax=Labrys wisconsinensis TaxID=425677 RepID=A0ABU0J9P8_9HYPH|nr:TetR/AcrR family transcriptional regulator [Labrys wisconsinensis]MDQ0470994.1 AcrR family transcriptional regulator [Labrys wisconsinensis]